MKENKVLNRITLSLKKVGLRVTFVKAFRFAKNYLPKTPFERMMILRYRRQVDPLELEEPALQAPEYQEDIDFSSFTADLRAVAFFDPAAERFENETSMVQELSAAAAAAAKHGVYGFCFFWRSPADTELLSVLQKHA